MSTQAHTGSRELRRANLSRVLRLVHEEGAASRAALTRRTGLSRSTIADLVASLEEAGLVVERDPTGTGGVGRPSPVVHASADVVAIGTGVEADAVTVAVVGLDGAVAHRIRHEYEAEPSAAATVEIVGRLVDSLAPALTGARVLGIGAAVPGLVSAADGLVRMVPHAGWVDEPIARLLADRTGLPAFADNDANLGAAAESTFGAGRGLSSLVYLHGGPSGIGSGVRLGGTAPASAHGFAAELGHTLVDPRGARCRCGATGCLETEVRFDLLLDVLGRDRLDLPDVSAALREAASPEVDAFVAEQLRRLATGLRNAVNAFDPEAVVLGGFLGALFAEQPETLLAALRAQLMPPIAESLVVVRGALGEDRLLIGAAQLALRGLLEDPLGA
ncbi:ROK family transcriptional regulator [Agrococcus jenensis]|uniref:Putative NBD/HSP70 family sugar kinase n=1 Tax=Agrococcus jenensis TaxID=46353 RepID=A0A3N2APQ8_9MICO|nr:ROK family transcriptional regulator [Agrococcus jenensis]ROR65039.1 putative NBD/HSP70 family sugar kinase [Agrococcus jenensis]